MRIWRCVCPAGIWIWRRAALAPVSLAFTRKICSQPAGACYHLPPRTSLACRPLGASSILLGPPQKPVDFLPLTLDSTASVGAARSDGPLVDMLSALAGPPIVYPPATAFGSKFAAVCGTSSCSSEVLSDLMSPSLVPSVLNNVSDVHIVRHGCAVFVLHRRLCPPRPGQPRARLWCSLRGEDRKIAQRRTSLWLRMARTPLEHHATRVACTSPPHRKPRPCFSRATF